VGLDFRAGGGAMAPWCGRWMWMSERRQCARYVRSYRRQPTGFCVSMVPPPAVACCYLLGLRGLLCIQQPREATARVHFIFHSAGSSRCISYSYMNHIPCASIVAPLVPSKLPCVQLGYTGLRRYRDTHTRIQLVFVFLRGQARLPGASALSPDPRLCAYSCECDVPSPSAATR
jgi:hypothetical protein